MMETHVDQWYMNILPVIIRENGFLTQSEHIKLVEWKMHQGKFRPSLLKYAKDLDPDDVKRVTREALLSPDAYTLIKIYSTLKGVGIATASALCAAKFPHMPFMSDELLAQVFPPPYKFKYTKKEYEACVAFVHEKMKLA